ncbi:MAG: serine/threonine protein kinase [Chloroflexota bacterium]|nr:serine/threonine protein kinase [Chloroflexota bacterium]
MGNPLAQAFASRRPGGIVGRPTEGQPGGTTELAVDRVLEQRYRILETSGTGGSSQVYLAHDAVLGREVAIKLLDPRAAADTSLRRLFVKEARALAQLSHPNIVAVHDVGEVDGLPFIVMEHITGPSLKEHIQHEGPLPVAEAVHLAVRIATGLDFAHSRGIIHADLKPSNVLLDEDGRPKICDFGIARSVEEGEDSGQLFATAQYVAPERVEGKKASTATDVYGLGLVLYEMLVGKPPFTSSYAAVLLRDHVVRQPVPPSHLRPSLPKELDDIVLRALAKDPGLRYTRASEMAAALERIEDTGSTVAFAPVVHPASGIMTQPMQDFVPTVAQSPVVALLSAHAQPVRRAFYAVLAALPVFGLMQLAGISLLASVLVSALIFLTAFAGQLGLALGLGWLVETILLFLFVPGLAILFGLMGLWIWLRDIPAEQTAFAIAMPVTAPFGFGPALALTATAVHGLTGVATVAWGSAMTVLLAVAVGRESFGPFVQTGLTVEQDSLFSPVRLSDMKTAILNALQPAVGDRFGPLAQQLEPATLLGQLGTFAARLSSADVAWIATIATWVVSALAVWTITRVLRSAFDVILRRPKRWFVLYVFATMLGVAAGAAVLYLLFETWAPLVSSAERPISSLLLVSAVTGALVALAAGVVIGAIGPGTRDEDEEPLPSMAARRIPVR